MHKPRKACISPSECRIMRHVHMVWYEMRASVGPERIGHCVPGLGKGRDAKIAAATPLWGCTVCGAQKVRKRCIILSSALRVLECACASRTAGKVYQHHGLDGLRDAWRPGRLRRPRGAFPMVGPQDWFTIG